MCRIPERHAWLWKRISSSHHTYGRPGNPTSITVPVHRNKALGVGIQRKIMSLAGLLDDDL